MVLRKSPKAKFVFAGEGDMRPQLEAKASAIDITPSVRFIGYRAGKDLVGLFKSADLIVVPSRNEPFGIVILEAWSASKAVVATRTGGPGLGERAHRDRRSRRAGFDGEEAAGRAREAGLPRS